jgi:glycosyltransferase involved in cell wall biosynthesis
MTTAIGSEAALENKLRILWVSNSPHVPSGYGKQTALFTPRIKALGHEVAIASNCGSTFAPVGWNGITCYPQPLGQPHGLEAIGYYSAHFKADITLYLYDLWPLETYNIDLTGVRLVPWFPVDGEPISPMVARPAKSSFQPLVYSKHALAECEKADIPAWYVPHGVDTAIYRPFKGGQKEARKALGWPEDAFIYGMVAANADTPSRKSFAETIEAFAQVKKQHTDAILFLHTNPKGFPNGVDIPAIISYFGLEGSVILPKAEDYALGLVKETDLACIYNAFDVLVGVSQGEGFGVPLLEAQSCGIPVITGDWSAMSELCFSGWKLQKEDSHPYLTTYMAYWRMPKPGAIAELMLHAYDRLQNSDYRKVALENAREGALFYDVDRITAHHWKPVLEEMARKVADAKKSDKSAGYWKSLGELVSGKA